MKNIPALFWKIIYTVGLRDSRRILKVSVIIMFLAISVFLVGYFLSDKEISLILTKTSMSVFRYTFIQILFNQINIKILTITPFYN